MTQRILVTGATGYIGGRLIPRLLDRGDTVRVLVRDKARAQGLPWAHAVEIVEGDLLQPDSLPPAIKDIDTAYYLVHAMGTKGDFAQRDRDAAQHFAKAAAAAQVAHTIYLGGLQPIQGHASPHLASRAEVGRVLADHLPTTEFRAGPIIGSGSASFEMVRYLRAISRPDGPARWALARSSASKTAAAPSASSAASAPTAHHKPSSPPSRPSAASAATSPSTGPGSSAASSTSSSAAPD